MDAEIYRALHQTILQERQLQLIDRKAGNIFRIRADKLNDEEQRWRIQIDERQASA